MKELTLRIPGYTIAGKAWGDPTNPPLLALHGWLDNANSFDLIAPNLAKTFYFIAIDLPGHGHSSHLPEGYHYHFIDAVLTIAQIINTLKYQKIHLIGHSMGACLASLTAGILNDRILSLSLIEGLGPFSSPEEDCNKQLHQYVLHNLNTSSIELKPYPSLDAAAQGRAKRGHLSFALAKILTLRGTIEKEGVFYWQHDRRLIRPSPLQMTEGQVLSCLKEIHAKTCLIWADEGFSFSHHQTTDREAAISSLLVHQMKGGHHIHMEQPDRVFKILNTFYKTIL